jgi:hypothetical protein
MREGKDNRKVNKKGKKDAMSRCGHHFFKRERFTREAIEGEE